MQVKNSRYISEILYNAYQRDPNLKMDEASFREIVKSVTGGNCFSSPGSQLLLDYEDWKKTQPPRQLPGSKGMTEENIAYLKENYSGRLTMFGKIDALDTMVEMGILTEKEKMEAVVGRYGTDREFNFFHFMLDLSGGPCVAKRLSGCGSGTEYLAVTPWGDLYPCHQFVGEEKYLMGNVDEGITRPSIREEFKNCNVYSKEKCRDCFAKFYCSGGCAANAYKFHGSINEAYEISCELERKRVECAIMIKAAQAEKDEA